MPGSIKPDWPKGGLSRNFPTSLFTEYETGFLPKHLYCKVESQTNVPGFSSFKPMQFAGSENEVKNFTNPGLA